MGRIICHYQLVKETQALIVLVLFFGAFKYD